jgi:hypothetical protein
MTGTARDCTPALQAPGHKLNVRDAGPVLAAMERGKSIIVGCFNRHLLARYLATAMTKTARP